MVLGRKIVFDDGGAMSGTFWLKGWLNMKQILQEIVPLVSPKKILAVNIKYIHGLSGEETEVRFFAVSIVEMEVQNGEKRREESKEN